MEVPSDTIPAPRTQLSADGSTATAGPITLSVDTTKDLPATGTTVTVTGRGYDELKGIYVAFCKLPKKHQTPSPCGGGATTTGATGASQWISSNPPPYGQGLAVAYGPGGSFETTLTVNAQLAPRVDCREVQCGVVTRNDHVRSTDRSQDVIVPVTFTGSKLGAATTASSSGSGDGDGGGSALPIGIGAAVVVVAAVAGGIVLMRRRRSREDAVGVSHPPAATT